MMIPPMDIGGPLGSEARLLSLEMPHLRLLSFLHMGDWLSHYCDINGIMKTCLPGFFLVSSMFSGKRVLPDEVPWPVLGW